MHAFYNWRVKNVMFPYIVSLTPLINNDSLLRLSMGRDTIPTNYYPPFYQYTFTTLVTLFVASLQIA